MQIDIYNTGDNCWRIGLLKDCENPKNSARTVHADMMDHLGFEGCKHIFKKARKSIPGGNRRECEDRGVMRQDAISEESEHLNVSRS